MPLKIWRNFRKVSDWATENQDATDCSRMCNRCKKTWVEIRSEGRGEEMLHMAQAEKETPCGMPFEFICDPCLEPIDNNFI